MQVSFAHLQIAALLFSGPPLFAGTITFTGSITQSTQDGTGPATNNPSLNSIADGDSYSVELDFPGAITGAGAFNPLTGASAVLTDGSITETSFGAVFVNIYADSDPTLYDISVLACLTTGGGCFGGNSLSANFSVPAASFDSMGASASFLPGLVPSMDLLEDDGVTDIQGTVTGFSNVGIPTASTPEPSSLLGVLMALCLMARVRPVRFLSIPNKEG